MARIAVTGGTGFVGTWVTRALAGAGHEVRLVARGLRRSSSRPAGVELVRADVVRGEGLAGAFAGCDAVVHLVAVIRERGGQTFDAVNRRGTENVGAAAREAGAGHLVHLSAIGADPDPRYPYLATKWAGEQAVQLSGVPWTILRSSLVFGPGDEFFTRLVRLIRLNPVVPVIGGGHAMFQPIAATDLARIITLCIERGPQRRIVEVGGPAQLSLAEILRIIRAQIGAHRPMVPIPVAAVLPAAMVMDRLLPHPPVTPDQLRLLEKHNITRVDAVRTSFGFEPASFADSSDYLQDY